VVVAVQGSFDDRTSPEVERIIDDLIETRAGRRIVVDLAGVISAEPDSFGVLASAYRRARQRNLEVMLADPSDVAYCALVVTGISRLISIVARPRPAVRLDARPRRITPAGHRVTGIGGHRRG
jgi:anti-anti-sigma factor